MRAESKREPNDVATECRIALLVGGDLEDDARAEVERRLAACARARACRDEMQWSLDVLHACRDRVHEMEPESTNEAASLWPELRTRLAVDARRSSGRGLLDGVRPWVPSLTVAALVLALATVATSPPPQRGGGDVPTVDGEWAIRPQTVFNGAGRASIEPLLLPAESRSLSSRFPGVDDDRMALDDVLPPGGSRALRRSADRSEFHDSRLQGGIIVEGPDGRRMLLVPIPAPASEPSFTTRD